jgi:hypothetical protein
MDLLRQGEGEDGAEDRLVRRKGCEGHEVRK